jgi:hypothetical protein
LGNVADVSVVYYNAGSWSLYFDGTAHGLTAGSDHDIDAFDISTTSSPPVSTATPLPPTGTPTILSATATATAVPPTPTKTATPLPATSTATAVPATPTPTATGLPPTATPTAPASTDLYFSTVGNTAVPGVTAVDNAHIYSWNGSAYSLAFDAALGGLPNVANVDGYDRIDDTHFYLSFSAGTTSVPGLGSVEDEDVVYYDNGVWSLYFDGTPLGLTSSGLDLDAINIQSGILYFSTNGNATVPTVSGSADDADIYSWNGSSFARVWDASANGLPGSANVDGFVRTDATHFYLSFSSTSTSVSGLGNVADVSVVYYNAGSWSLYFDGTAHGLTAGSDHDIDAFDIP